MIHIAMMLPMMTGDDYNSQVVIAIGALFGALFTLIQPLLSTLGLLVIFYLLLAKAFHKRR